MVYVPSENVFVLVGDVAAFEQMFENVSQAVSRSTPLFFILIVTHMVVCRHSLSSLDFGTPVRQPLGLT